MHGGTGAGGTGAGGQAGPRWLRAGCALEAKKRDMVRAWPQLGPPGFLLPGEGA